MKIQVLCLTASVLALGSGGFASAQTTASAQAASGTTTQEVVVTAERRSTNLQKTAIAATVLTGADLLKRGFSRWTSCSSSARR